MSEVPVRRVGNAEVEDDQTRVPFSFRGLPLFATAPPASLVSSPPRSRRRAGVLPYPFPTRASSSTLGDSPTAVCGRVRRGEEADEPRERSDDRATDDGQATGSGGEAELARCTVVVVLFLVEVVVRNGLPPPLPCSSCVLLLPLGGSPVGILSRGGGGE